MVLDRDGHLLMIRYVIQSNGDGDDEDFVLLTAAWILHAVISCLVLFAWLYCLADWEARFRWLCSRTSLKNVPAP